MRLGCLLVCFALVLTLMLPQQRAYAVEPVTMTVVASLAVAYFGACGLTFITQNMDKDALVSSVQRLLQEFLDTELGGISIQDWLGTVWDVAVLNTKILMGRPLTNELLTFAQWVAQKYAAQAGENVVYQQKGFTSVDGVYYDFGFWDAQGNHLGSKLGTNIFGSTAILPGASVSVPVTSDFTLEFSVVDTSSTWDNFWIPFSGNYESANQKSAGWYCENLCFVPYDHDGILYLSIMRYWPACLSTINNKGSAFMLLPNALGYSIRLSELDLVDTDLSIDRAPSVSYIPEGIEAKQGIALDVGATPTMDLSQILQQVLEDVLAGTLTSSMEIADAEDVPVDPPAGEITDVDGLGLPALGAALTSRFPFSIPWDFSRAVQLLAAPAKAPYFEVDLLEPIAYRVGGWQGSTKIVLDFSEFEIIGQVSRWTSTIGFCLMLAGATKRLIWTA